MYVNFTHFTLFEILSKFPLVWLSYIFKIIYIKKNDEYYTIFSELFSLKFIYDIHWSRWSSTFPTASNLKCTHSSSCKIYYCYNASYHPHFTHLPEGKYIYIYLYIETRDFFTLGRNVWQYFVYLSKQNSVYMFMNHNQIKNIF